jgi:hypothetical protein
MRRIKGASMKNYFPLSFEDWCEAKGIETPIPFSGQTDFMAREVYEEMVKEANTKIAEAKNER